MELIAQVVLARDIMENAWDLEKIWDVDAWFITHNVTPLSLTLCLIYHRHFAPFIAGTLTYIRTAFDTDHLQNPRIMQITKHITIPLTLIHSFDAFELLRTFQTPHDMKSELDEMAAQTLFNYIKWCVECGRFAKPPNYADTETQNCPIHPNSRIGYIRHVSNPEWHSLNTIRWNAYQRSLDDMPTNHMEGIFFSYRIHIPWMFE